MTYLTHLLLFLAGFAVGYLIHRRPNRPGAAKFNLNATVALARRFDSLPACSQITCDVPMFDNYDDMARAHLAYKKEPV